MAQADIYNIVSLQASPADCFVRQPLHFLTAEVLPAILNACPVSRLITSSHQLH